MNPFMKVIVLVVCAPPAFGTYPFNGVAVTDTITGRELSGAFYHAGKDKLFSVHDGSPNNARILSINPGLPSGNPVLQEWTNDLSIVNAEDLQRDLEGITFKSSDSATDDVCFILDENQHPDDNKSSILEYDLAANSGAGDVVRRLSLSPINEPNGQGPEAITWVPAWAFVQDHQPMYGGGYFFVGWENQFDGSGTNRVWVFEYTSASLDALELVQDVSGFTDGNGTFLISGAPTSGEQFRDMHFDPTSRKLWALFADGSSTGWPQTVIVSNAYGQNATTYTYNGSGGSGSDFPAWEGIAMRVCPSSATYSLYLTSDHASSGAQDGKVFGFDHCFPEISVGQSEKAHGSAGTFVIHVFNSDVECRSGGVSTLRILFRESVQNDPSGPVTASNVMVSSGTVGMVTQPAGNTVLIPFSVAPTNNTPLGVEFVSVIDAHGLPLTQELCVYIAAGDANDSRTVTTADDTFCQAFHNQTTNASNFRCDLNFNGTIQWPSVGVGADRDIWRANLDASVSTTCP